MLLVINVVGLTPNAVGENTPRIAALAREGFLAPLQPAFPAVTCTAQATMLTGALPREHGIVANGWYFRDLAQVWLWRQSNHLIETPRLYDDLKAQDPTLSIAKVFWWYNMYADVDYAVTPRPAYLADGRKAPDIYADPTELRTELVDRFGPFPLFHFWGPASDIRSSRWIADAGLHVLEQHRPDLTFVYLPHLDYDLQRFGPDDPRVQEDHRQVDREVGRLIDQAKSQGAKIVVLSEYGIEGVDKTVCLNQALREAGFLEVFTQIDGEHLDAGKSRAFAMVDHQVAHVYVRRPEDMSSVRSLLESLDGVSRVLDEDGKREMGLDHARSGELVVLAERGCWFPYYYWLDEDRAPDYARTVDIHKKPGYDPVELFLDPQIRWPKAKIGWTLLRKKLGFRTLMDVISLDPSLVRGSHGLLPSSPGEGAVLIGDHGAPPPGDPVCGVPMTSIKDYIMGLVRESRG